MSMTYADQFKKYKEQRVFTLTPGELIILLYDEATMNINMAIQNIQKKKVEEAHNRIAKAEKIVLYLIDCLDMSIPISKEILPFYEFIYTSLVKANVKKDAALLEDILKLTVEFKNTWQKAELSTRTNQSSLGRSI